jgi:two-component system response regulator YesN
MLSVGSAMKRVILVEDDRSVSAALTQILLAHGIDVVTLTSFEEARHYLERNTPDVLITDIRLGEFNGLQLAIIVKTRHPTCDVMVISGYDDAVLREEARRVGAIFRLKPVSGREIIEFIGEGERHPDVTP